MEARGKERKQQLDSVFITSLTMMFIPSHIKSIIILAIHAMHNTAHGFYDSIYENRVTACKEVNSCLTQNKMYQKIITMKPIIDQCVIITDKLNYCESLATTVERWTNELRDHSSFVKKLDMCIATAQGMELKFVELTRSIDHLRIQLESANERQSNADACMNQIFSELSSINRRIQTNDGSSYHDPLHKDKRQSCLKK